MPVPEDHGRLPLSHNLPSRCHQAELRGLPWGLTAVGHFSSPPWARVLEAGLTAFHFTEPGSHLHTGEVSPTEEHHRSPCRPAGDTAGGYEEEPHLPRGGGRPDELRGPWTTSAARGSRGLV